VFRSTQLSIKILNIVSRAYTGEEVGVTVNVQPLGGKLSVNERVVILGKMYAGLYAENLI
jgi:hypothetical protein